MLILKVKVWSFLCFILVFSWFLLPLFKILHPFILLQPCYCLHFFSSSSCFLFNVVSLEFTVYCLLFNVNCLIFTVYCLLYSVYCLLFTDNCFYICLLLNHLLFAICCLLVFLVTVNCLKKFPDFK